MDSLAGVHGAGRLATSRRDALLLGRDAEAQQQQQQQGGGWDQQAAALDQRGKRPASQESDEALRDRQELETWNREASREDLGSWASAKDLDQTWEKEKDRLENWGQADSDEGKAAARSEVVGGLERAGEGAAGPGAAATDASGELDKAARSASEIAARARQQQQGEYAGRRNVGGGAGGAGGTYNQAGSMSSGAGSGAPCGACKFLRRKCVRGCIFAPYFSAEQGAAKFAAVHKVFGASNVAKLLLHIPAPRRSDAVLTISYEAQARLSDPVYGCVATIFALQQQVRAPALSVAGCELTAGAGDGADATSGSAHAPATSCTPPAAADGGVRVAGDASGGVHAAASGRRPPARPVADLGPVHGHAWRLRQRRTLLAREAGGGQLLPRHAAPLRHGHAVQQPGAHGHGAEPPGVAAVQVPKRPTGRGRAAGSRVPPAQEVACMHQLSLLYVLHAMHFHVY